MYKVTLHFIVGFYKKTREPVPSVSVSWRKLILLRKFAETTNLFLPAELSVVLPTQSICLPSPTTITNISINRFDMVMEKGFSIHV